MKSPFPYVNKDGNETAVPQTPTEYYKDRATSIQREKVTDNKIELFMCVLAVALTLLFCKVIDILTQ